MNHHNKQQDVESPAIAAIAAVSKTPFTTALKLTLAIGIGRLLNLAMGIGFICGIYLILKNF